MLSDSWTLLYIGVMFLMVVIEVLQIAKSFGKPLVNVVQLFIYLGSAIWYWVGFGKGEFSFGFFLRITMIAFIISVLLEVLFFPKMAKVEKTRLNVSREFLLLILFLLLKLLPLILLILFVTDPFLTN